jgi:predicted ester cyclase
LLAHVTVKKEAAMSAENKALVRRFYDEVFGKKNVNAIDELCAPGFVDHSPAPGQAPGPQGLKAMFTEWFQGFPDATLTVQDMVAEGDLVVARLSGQGTHTGSLLGTAPTGKKVTFRGMDMIRLKDGRAIEVWHEGNDAEVLMQLGVQLPV